jgi:hypothetical protein
MSYKDMFMSFQEALCGQRRRIDKTLPGLRCGFLHALR